MKNDGAKKIFPFQTLIFNIFWVERILVDFGVLEGVKLCRLAARRLTWGRSTRRGTSLVSELHGRRNVGNVDAVNWNVALSQWEKRPTKDWLVTFYTESETMTQTLITSIGSAINGHATSPSSGHFKLKENSSEFNWNLSKRPVHSTKNEMVFVEWNKSIIFKIIDLNFKNYLLDFKN